MERLKKRFGKGPTGFGKGLKKRWAEKAEKTGQGGQMTGGAANASCRIIDAHIHFCCGDDYFDLIAGEAGHQNTREHLERQFKDQNVACGVVMGNRGLEMEKHQYPEFLRYCIGLDSSYLFQNQVADAVDQVEAHLQRDQCAGVKLYPGYSPFYVTDPIYEPVFELAEKYGKAVAVHTGATAGSGAILKYSHPLTLDEVAVRHPYVQLVMCHFGSPWLMDAAAVVDKNDNVAADLSGLLEGRVNLDVFFEEKAGFLEQLRAWLGYLDQYDRIMYGTDWPLANLEEYQLFIRRLVPEKFHQKVFFDNANRVYKLGLDV